MAGRVQLATKGAHDAYFTDNPDYSHFIKRFRKHSKFSVYNVKHDLHGDGTYGSTLTCTIPADAGDMLTSVRVYFELPILYDGAQYYKYIESIGHALIEHVDMFIGSEHIQRIPSDYLQIYSENFVTQTKQRALSKLIGKCPLDVSGTPVESSTIKGFLGNATTQRQCIVDIPFYFYNNPELAIPLCAIKHQECRFEMKLRDRSECIIDLSNASYKPIIDSVKIETELMVLGDVERIKLQNANQDHIITQIQNQNFNVPESSSVDIQELSFKMEFINSVKELYFVIKRNGSSVFDYDHTLNIISINGNLEYINYEHLKELTISMNGEELIDSKSGNVIALRAVQSGIHHSRTQLFRRFYSYSFALEPERWYPTGQRNMSLVKEQKIQLKLNGKSVERELRVYAISYNILRYENGGVRLLFNSGTISH
jgi:type VI protein secretion system component Hcp